jgi:hypothetical protein
VLLAAAQPADVRTVGPEHEHRDGEADEEEGRAHADREQEQRGKQHRADEAPERDVAGDEHDADEHGEGDRHRDRREGEEDAGGRGDPLSAAAQAEPDRPHVAGDRGDAAADRPEQRIARADDARRKEQRGERALQRIGEKDDDADLPAEDAEHVRRAEVSRALRAQIDAAQPARDRGERNGAGEIREREREPGLHGYAAAAPPLLRRSTMRSGLPVNGHVSRKPLCRKRT